MSRGKEFEAAWWRPYSMSDTIREFASVRDAFVWLRAQVGEPVEGSIIRRRCTEGWRVVGSWPGLPPEEWQPPQPDAAWLAPPPQEHVARRIDPPIPQRRSAELDAALGIPTR